MLLLYFLVWVIFNGAVTGEILLFGVGVALLIFGFVCKFMDYNWHKELLIYRRGGYFLWYILVLVVEIVRANIAVIRLIVSRRVVPEPVLVVFRTRLKTRMGRVILANSITLTPGTITVSLNGDELVVHCLDKSMSEGMDTSVFVTMLEKLERMGR